MIIFISGDYSNIPSNADGLHRYLAPLWLKAGMKIDKFFRYDQDAEIRAAVMAVPIKEKLIVIGFSWGGDEAVKVAADTSRIIDIMILIDPCHRSGSGPFSLSPNILRAYCWHRQASDCRTIQSFGIGKAKCKYYHGKFTPKPGDAEAAQHGQPARDPAEIIAVMRVTGGI